MWNPFAKKEETPVPLEGPLSDRKVFELVRAVDIGGPGPIYGIVPVDAGTIYKVRDGFDCEYAYFQSIDGKLVQSFKKHDLLVI